MDWRGADRLRALTRPEAVAIEVVLVTLVVRVALADVVGLAPDEAYYLTWSRRLAAGYLDHPPAVAWLIALSTKLFGETALGVRLPAVILGGLVLPAALLWLGREAGLDARGRSLLALAAVVQPLGVAAGLLITPDVPLILFWTSSAALVLRATRTRSSVAWALAGVAVGGALLSKHSGWVLMASVAIGSIVEPAARSQMRTRGPWLGIVSAIVVASPNLVWDATRGFPSLLFQLHHGLAGGEGALAPLGPVELFAGQVALLTPLVAWAVIWALWRGAPPVTGGRLLLAMAVVPLAVFGVASLLAHPEANWPAPAHPLLLAVALAWLGADDKRLEAGPGRSHRRFVAAAVVSSGALTAAATFHLLWPLPFFPPGVEPAARLRAWDDLPSWLTDLDEAVVHADDYELASALSFHLPTNLDVSVRCAHEGRCPRDAVAVVAAVGASTPSMPLWFRSPGQCAVELGVHAMRRQDGEVVRTLRAFTFRPCHQ